MRYLMHLKTPALLLYALNFLEAQVFLLYQQSELLWLVESLPNLVEKKKDLFWSSLAINYLNLSLFALNVDPLIDFTI